MKIGVLMGGRSPEREISKKTGKNIVDGLRKAGYNVVGIDALENISEEIKRENIDMAFIALHGPLGEDGTIQGLLEFIDIPYTGSGVMASSLAMNKIMTKKVLRGLDILTPPGYNFNRKLLETPEGIGKIKRKAEQAGVQFPVIVKPSAGGSTIGMAIVKDSKDLPAAYWDAAKYCDEILVEKYFSGIELTVGVLGADDPLALPVIEIIAVGGFYNYTTKYQPGMSTHIIPARIPKELYIKAQQISVRIFKELCCFGMGRIDFILEGENLWALEVNTIPGMTETSLLPEAAARAGIDFVTLLKDQVKFALNRYNSSKFDISFVPS